MKEKRVKNRPRRLKVDRMKNEKDDKGLAGLLLKPYIVEILLILTNEGPKMVKEIVGKLQTDDKSVKQLLGEMRGFELIDHHGDLVYITSYGESIAGRDILKE